MGGGAREVTSWRNGKCRDSEPHGCAVVGEEDGEGGEGNPLGELKRMTHTRGRQVTAGSTGVRYGVPSCKNN